jgi:CRISPR-associated protein Cmr5
MTQSENIIRTRDQKRAELVFPKVRELEGGNLAKKYGAVALSAATLIRTAGLVQAIAFYEAKDKDHHKKLLEHLKAELNDLGVLPTGRGLREYAASCDLLTYMRLTRETIALCQWHKRFAQSVLKVEPGEDDES